MTKSNVSIAPVLAPKVKKEKISKEEKLDLVNIDKAAEKADKVSKPNIYTFDYEGLNTDQLKSKRQSARKKLESYMNKIISSSDLQKDPEYLAESIKGFKTFYAEVYILNDFSSQSVRSKVSEKEKKDLDRMFTIIQSHTGETPIEKKKDKVKK